jgi:hypothetical protein
VAERQVREHLVGGPELVDLGVGVGGRDQVRVGQHRALRRPGGAGRVDDDRHARGVDLGDPALVFLAGAAGPEPLELLERHQHRVVA